MSNLTLLQRCRIAFAEGLGADQCLYDFDTDNAIISSPYHKITIRCDDFDNALRAVMLEVAMEKNRNGD